MRRRYFELPITKTVVLIEPAAKCFAKTSDFFAKQVAGLTKLGVKQNQIHLDFWQHMEITNEKFVVERSKEEDRLKWATNHDRRDYQRYFNYYWKVMINFIAEIFIQILLFCLERFPAYLQAYWDYCFAGYKSQLCQRALRSLNGLQHICCLPVRSLA